LAKHFLNISDYFEKNRKIFWFASVLLCIIAAFLAKNARFEEGISKAFRIAFTLIFFMLLIIYGRIELALISIAPTLATFIWLAGTAAIFDIRLNITTSIITASFLSLSAVQSFFIMRRLLQAYKTGRENSLPGKSSDFISAIAILAGLGAIIFTRQPASQHPVTISIVGLTGAIFLPHLLIPFLFDILINNRARKKFFPWTFFGLLKSAFAFTYFVVASLILTLLGLLFVKLYPFNKEKGKLVYHACVSKFCWSLMYIMGNVKKKIVNIHGEDFSKPAVIICNHQSFLDILTTVMLTPKLILFTNHWVWNSPVFGFVVRMADYYPVMQGADGSIELVADRVKRGYSVVVFPEGTRSADGNMKRFHKGAFFLAEKLRLDILPILIHGSGYTMSKGDFLLKDGTITLHFLPRIKPADRSFGNGYAERTKSVGRYFRAELNRLQNQLGNPSFFKEQLIYNYIYKGPVLEWYMRIKLRVEKNYNFFNDVLPKKGKLLDAGCGYGFMTYMLHFTSKERTITGVDYDEKKIVAANHCFSKTEKINFIHADVLLFNYEKYDGIILSDVLHYLQPVQQKQAIRKCMQNLNENGVLIIRDGNKDLSGRHLGTKITEFFSTTFSGFNKTTENGLSFLSGSLIREVANEQKMECTDIDQSKYTSNIIFVIRKNPVAIHAAV
jgi:uncharacterized protein